MDGDPQLHLKVARAVHFLQHGIPSNRVAANQWLVQLQHSPQAWSVAISILTSEDSLQTNFEAEFFAAQILKRKIQAEGSSLQLPHKEVLRNALLQAVRRFSIGPAPLLTQICLALSALVMRTVEYEKPVEHLFLSLPSLQNQENGSTAVLEILTVLPEEVIEDQNSHCHIDSNNTFRFYQELLSQSQSVLNFLLAHSESSENGLKLHERNRKILRCLLSWVRADCLLEIPALSTHPLFDFVFSALQDSSSFEMAIEVLTELVSRYEDLPRVLLSRVHYLKERLLMPAITIRDENIIGGLSCMLSEVGQAAPALIGEAGGEALVLLESLLSCVAFPADEWEIADSTLQFWCCLASYLLDLDAENKRKKVEDVFASIYSTLLDALLLRAQVDNVSMDEENGSYCVPDGLLHFRTNLEELLIDICELMGSSWFLQKIFSIGWAVIPWTGLECRLFMLNVVAESVLQEGLSFDVSIVMRLIEILTPTPPEKLKGFMGLVYKSVAEVITSYSKLIFAFQENIHPIILFCAGGITESLCSSSCSLTLHRLCEDSAWLIHDTSDFEILIQIGEGFAKRYLSFEEEEGIIGAIILVLGSVPNMELRHNMLDRLLLSCYGTVEKLIVADGDSVFRQHHAAYMFSINSAVMGLYRMGAVFDHLPADNSQIGVEDDRTHFLRVVWPLLEKLFKSVHIRNNNLSSAACRCLSLAVKSSGALELLPGMLDCLSTNFLSFQDHDCYVKTATVIIKEFSHKEVFGGLFVSTFEKFTSASSIVALSTCDCDQEPDLAEAYLNFASTYIRYCHKDVLVASGSLLELSFQKAATCCTALSRGTALSAMSYMLCFLELTIVSLLDSTISVTEVSLSSVTIRILSRSAEGLVSNIFYALLGVTAISRVHKLATILQQIAAICRLSEKTNFKAVLCWESLHGWLHSTVTSLPADSLKPGEIESLVPVWLESLSGAASDILGSPTCNSVTQNHGPLQGKGGRALKRIIRNFAETHRNSPIAT